jgi:hypothetical protein
MSFISTPAQTVLTIAERQIAEILAVRETRNVSKIIRVVEESGRPWLWGLIKRTPLSREQAIKRLDRTDDEIIFVGWRSQYRETDLTILRKLMLLAEHGDPVFITGEDAEVLWGKIQ